MPGVFPMFLVSHGCRSMFWVGLQGDYGFSGMCRTRDLEVWVLWHFAIRDLGFNLGAGML